jgi:transcriptional regulator with XRE-family HTH domain
VLVKSIFCHYQRLPQPRRHNDAALLSKLGKSIQAARRKAGITQEELAERAEVNARALQKIEAGDSDPQTSTLVRIKNAIGCSWDAILPAGPR